MGADTFLTSLASVKQWLNIPTSNTDADALLTRMIKTISAHVINHLNRDGMALDTYRDVYDSYGKSFMLLRRSPVYQILGLSFNGTPIPAASGDGFTTPYSNGYVLEPEYSVLGTQRLNLYGYVFPRARGSVMVHYTAGYVTLDEAGTVPASSEYIVTTLQHWLADVGVKYASSGASLTKVASAPAAGEYSVADGVYTFNAADASADVLISYSFVPADIENAVIELVGERYKYMDRIGILSKALGGQETISYSQKEMSDFVKANLTPYMQTTPI